MLRRSDANSIVDGLEGLRMVYIYIAVYSLFESKNADIFCSVLP